MPRFFSKEIQGNTFLITGEDASHISRVLRCKLNEEIIICDMNGTDYSCHISAMDTNGVLCTINSSNISITEPKIKLTLYMAMPKADKAELIIQKAVELGATEIIFIMSHRCVSRPDDKSWVKKLSRFNKISYEAAKQSQRGIIPEVKGLLSFKEAVQSMKSSDISMLFYENSTEKLSSVLNTEDKTISLIVGSEGGFEQSEVDYAVENGVKSLSLGMRILRCETAPIVAISAIMYHMGEF